MKASESLKLMGKAVAYYPKLAKPLGGVSAAVLFCHFFYWHDKTDNPLGIYKTAEQIEDETGLTEQEQRTARAKLRALGMLIETDKRIEHRKYYKLDIAVFDELMEQHSRTLKSTLQNSKINAPELQNQRSGSDESTFGELKNQRSYKGALDYQKNTTIDYNKSIEQDAIAIADPTKNLLAKNPTASKKEPNPANVKTWEAYRNAYLAVYQCEPIRNAKVNSQIANFVKAVGEEAAPLIAQFYVGHPNQWYRTKGHDIGTLLANVQSIHTDYQRRMCTTSTQARQAEKTAANIASHDGALAILKKQGVI